MLESLSGLQDQVNVKVAGQICMLLLLKLTRYQALLYMFTFWSAMPWYENGTTAQETVLTTVEVQHECCTGIERTFDCVTQYFAMDPFRSCSFEGVDRA